jgi:hypothetical protein
MLPFSEGGAGTGSDALLTEIMAKSNCGTILKAFNSRIDKFFIV